MSDVIKTEERVPEAVSASDDAKDDHTGGLRFTDIGSEHTHTHAHTHTHTHTHTERDY